MLLPVTTQPLDSPGNTRLAEGMASVMTGWAFPASLYRI